MNPRRIRFLVACAACTACALLLGSAALSLADAPPKRYVIDANKGTVLDTSTGLQWQRSLSTTTYGWSDAKTYCQNLPLDGGGWRLPTSKELLTLVDPRRYNPAIDPNAFPDTPAEFFWTSTTYVGASGYAWYVLFVGGTSNSIATMYAYRARCVR